MKEILYTAILLFYSFSLSAQDVLIGKDSVNLSSSIVLTAKEKKSFGKLAKEIGVLKYFEVKDKSPEEFWSYVSNNNLRYGKFKKAIGKGTRMARNTVEEINEIVQRTLPQRKAMEFSADGELNESINTIENVFKEYIGEKNARIEIIDNEDINAFATPDGYIGINLGCIYTDWISINETFYLLGHEYSHSRLAHKYVHTYNQKRQNFKMNMIAGISSAVIAAGAIYEATLGVTDTVAVKSIGEIVTSANQLKEDFYFEFSREEEFEADTYSMYYMMNKGLSPYNAINLLDKFSKKFGDKETEKDDTHPSNSERKKFLYYILTEYNESL